MSDIIGIYEYSGARLYGQFSLDKTLTLQAGATVYVVWEMSCKK